MCGRSSAPFIAKERSLKKRREAEEEEGRLRKVGFLANLRRSDERCQDANAKNVNHRTPAPEDYTTTPDVCRRVISLDPSIHE